MNPWDDLTETELKEMVDFCREMFSLTPVQFSSGRSALDTKIEWKWKKGDWRASWRSETGKWHIDIISEAEVFLLKCNPNTDWIPLPLAHQWDNLFFSMEGEGKYAHDFYDDEGDDVPPEYFFRYAMNDGTLRGKVWDSNHNNPHYRRYLAYREVIEDD